MRKRTLHNTTTLKCYRLRVHQATRPTQLGHPSMGRRNEDCWWLWTATAEKKTVTGDLWPWAGPLAGMNTVQIPVDSVWESVEALGAAERLFLEAASSSLASDGAQSTFHRRGSTAETVVGRRRSRLVVVVQFIHGRRRRTAGRRAMRSAPRRRQAVFEVREERR